MSSMSAVSTTSSKPFLNHPAAFSGRTACMVTVMPHAWPASRMVLSALANFGSSRLDPEAEPKIHRSDVQAGDAFHRRDAS